MEVNFLELKSEEQSSDQEKWYINTNDGVVVVVVVCITFLPNLVCQTYYLNIYFPENTIIIQ